MASTDHALPIGTEAVTTGEWIDVRAPYDGALLGRVPACGPAEVDRAVKEARAVHEAGPLPAWKRAEILDTAARLLSERVEEFARIIATESAKPIKTARVEAQRAVSTFTFAAAVWTDESPDAQCRLSARPGIPVSPDVTATWRAMSPPP